MEQLLQESPYKVHLFVKDTKTDHYFIGKRLNEVFSSASLIKGPILLAVLDYLEHNNESLDQMIVIAPDSWIDFSVIS